MPDWTSDQMAGVRPEATRVFGRNAQIAAIRQGLGEIDPKRKLLLSFGTGELHPIAAVHGALDGRASLSHLLYHSEV